MKKVVMLFVAGILASSLALGSNLGISSGPPGNGKSKPSPSPKGGVIDLTFEGICDQCPIGNFYGSKGIYFSSNSLGLIEDEAGGSGNFANEPSPVTIAFFLNGTGDIMNIPAGFTTGFSFFYTSNFYAGSVTVWSGPSATGTLLASLALPVNNYSGEPCQQTQDDIYCNWSDVGVAFNGVAESVNFGGAANYIGFDNVTLGSSVASPEPGSLMLLGSGLLGLGGMIRRRLAK